MAELPEILAVCTGNVCRSPYMERRLQQMLDLTWAPSTIRVASAGMGALVGAPMDPKSLQRLEGLGGYGRDFAARQIDVALVAKSQLVVVAARAHRAAVARLYPRALGRTHALLDLAQLAQQVTDAEIAGLPQGDAGEHLSAAVTLVASKRGLVPPLPPERADVYDPFGQDEGAFDLMQKQIEDALPHVLRVLEKR